MAINFPDSPTNGQVFTSGSTSWTYDGTKWNLNTNVAVSNDSLPVGAIMWFGNTTTTPPGYIAADGSAVSRTTYATLFAVIGTTHGSGDGSTTFNVPNVASTTGKYFIRYTTSLGTQTTTSLSTAPVGTMIDWPVTSSYPTGWLRADGSAVSRTSYADLFALISTTYGTGDGSTTFNLPNMIQAGSGSPVGIIKASLGGIVEPSTVAHASSHIRGGSDIIDADRAQIDFVPSYYVRDSSDVNAGANTDLTAHLKGIDNTLNTAYKAGIYSWTQWNPTNVTGTVTNAPSTAVVDQKNTTYYTFNNSSGTLTVTFKIAGFYLVNITGKTNHSNSATFVRINCNVGGTCTKYAEGNPNGPYFEYSTTSAYGSTASKTYMIYATANQTATYLPSLEVQGNGLTSNHSANISVMFNYLGT